MAKLIGTAGHVDHGKTTLIRALTGIDADRLPEEKKRGMTIDIGFAFVDLPEVGRVSIVDVPGHEKFIHNMLVGALGIDVALLCVAADAGVMPQTREHLEILELLPVERLVVAMTRADLADADTLALARLEIEETLKETRFAGASLVPVSAVTGEGLPELQAALVTELKAANTPKEGPWYLPIDRAFAVKGHGTVVTGTLARGEVRVGDTAVLEPGGQEVRVRSLHAHGEALTEGEAGRRIAMNLGGIHLEDVHRGMAVGEPGALFESRVLDARMRWLKKPKHGLRVRLSAGAEEGIGKVFFNNDDPDLAQFRLEAPLALAKDQPLIVRRFSPMELLGGGRITVPQAKVRKKSEKASPLLEGKTEAEAILSLLGDSAEGMLTEEIARALGRAAPSLSRVFEELTQAGQIQGFAGRWVSAAGWAAFREAFTKALGVLHYNQPSVANHPREKVLEKASLKWHGKPLDRAVAQLSAEGKVKVEGVQVRLVDFQVQMSPKQRAFLDRVLAAMSEAGPNVPSLAELSKILVVPPQAVDEIVRLGLESREIVRVADGLYYPVKSLEALRTRVRAAFAEKSFSAAEFRDAIGTSRKYAIPLLEFFDSVRFTLRVGDNRVVRKE